MRGDNHQGRRWFFRQGGKDTLYTVVTIREVGSLKRLVQGIDPDAFVVISSTQEVMNYRIGNQPHW